VLDHRSNASQRNDRLRSCHQTGAATERRREREDAMRKHAYVESEHTQAETQVAAEATSQNRGLPNRLMTAFEVAEFIGCHEETVRRAYWRGLLTSQRFGVRGRRFHPADVLDWIRRGAPTRVS
jgi:excisionase family DNA binding protein